MEGHKYQKIFCCFGFCSAAMWTRAIAVLQIIAFFIAGVKGTHFLVRQYKNSTMTLAMMMTPPTRVTLTVAELRHTLNFGDVAFPPYVYVVRLVLILLLVLLPGIILAVLLLYGSVKKLPIYLTYWTVHAICCLIFYTLMAAVMGTFLKGFVRLSLFTFALWMVQVHKRELELQEDELLTPRPIAQNHTYVRGQGRVRSGVTPRAVSGGVGANDVNIPLNPSGYGGIGQGHNRLGQQRPAISQPPTQAPPYWKYGGHPQYNGGFVNVV